MPVTLLHTSDWHVGKAIRGASRADEHRAVLAEIAEIAAAESVDVVVVAGDLFDTSSPAPESEEIVYRALLDLAGTGAIVAVIAGNHDNSRRLRAVAPLLGLGNVHLVTEPTRPAAGGVLALCARDGTPIRLAMLPFVSKRGIVRAADLMDGEAFENAQRFSDRMRLLVEALCADFRSDTVNVLAAHAYVLGATTGGGGERPSHVVEEYAVTAASFPPTIGYGALGHLHRAQRVPAGAMLHYCGSPLTLDFGEDDGRRQVNVVTLEPGAPADVTGVALRSGRPLRTITGTFDELAALAGTLALADGAWLRVVVRGTRRAGLADEIRQVIGPSVVDVRVDAPDDERRARPRDHRGRSPHELFDEYLAGVGVVDDRVRVLFAELLDDELGSERDAS
ncbi:MAG: exonuclease SbcCD subunit D [Ilumatobacteraceae bacterium]